MAKKRSIDDIPIVKTESIGGRFSKRLIQTRDYRDILEVFQIAAETSETIEAGIERVVEGKSKFLKSKNLPDKYIVYHDNKGNWATTDLGEEYGWSILDKYIKDQGFSRDSLEDLAARVVSSVGLIKNQKSKITENQPSPEASKDIDILIEAAFHFGEANALFEVYFRQSFQETKDRKPRINHAFTALVKFLLNTHPPKKAIHIFNSVSDIEQTEELSIFINDISSEADVSFKAVDDDGKRAIRVSIDADLDGYGKNFKLNTFYKYRRNILKENK